MRKSFVVVGAALLFSMTAGAWNYPEWEAFAGYNFVRANPDSPFVPSQNLNGGNGQIAYNFNKWFSGVIDAGAATKGSIGGFDVNSTLAYITAGPRVTFTRDSRFQPYVQALFGGAYWNASTPITPLGVFVLPGLGSSPFLPNSTRIANGEWGFAMLVGGGVDIKVSKHFYVRPAEASYFLTHMSNPWVPFSGSTTRNNFRYSGGIKFTWGEPK
ncbi:MAG TPA: outer membrane beta-barrel protein [Bryobacteraceae bacterium]|nr:outer membrane beta-barrel protein [Bryobacteraceae bacterium]